MKVRCIKCGKEWSKSSEYPWPEGTVTHSMCVECFVAKETGLIRTRQLREGNFDCFARARDYCDQPLCKYRNFCVREVV